MRSTVELTDLVFPVSLGTYGPGDVVPEAHLLDLTLGIDAARVFIESDGMGQVFDYHPLIREIERLARDGHYETQEWLMTRIVRACAEHGEVTDVEISVKKRPVLGQTGTLGMRLRVSAADLSAMREQRG